MLWCAAIPSEVAAQHSFNPSGAFDPAVPTPQSVLGYQIGERFTPHHLLMRYLERLAATAGRRLSLDTVASSFEGREVMLAIVTSEKNRARLEQIRHDAGLVADPRIGTAGERQEAAARLPAIVWLGYSIHGGEASGVEAGIALLYQLAAGRDSLTEMVLDSTVVLIDPVENPDGHERHVQDVIRRRSAGGPSSLPQAMINAGSWPGPRTSHYYFDLNRDWFLISHPETRGRITTFLRWWPHVAVDLHEQGPDASYFFAPPMDPINKNVHSTILKWWDIFAGGNAAAFDAHGWQYFRREGYDEFYPGYGVSWPILNGAVGMTYEQATSAGGAIGRRDGTVLTLHDAAWHHYTAAWATLVTVARRARERVHDYQVFREATIADAAKLPFRTVVLERDPDGRADSLVQRLAANGITVARLRGEVAAVATQFGDPQPRPTKLAAGSYAIDLGQPQGRLAKALLEPDAELDSSFIEAELERRRTGQPNRFYDITAWSLPLTHRVRAWTVVSALTAVEPVRWIASPRSSIGRATSSYAFEPGSESSIRMLAALLADSVRVWFAPKAFTVSGASFPRGAFLVRLAGNEADVHDKVSRAAARSGAAVTPLGTSAVDSGVDLGSNSVFFVKAPRVGLLGGPPMNGNSFGFAWFAFDRRLGYPVTAIDAQAIGAGVLDHLDVLVVPSGPGAGIDHALGDAGRDRLVAWVRNGGTLVTLQNATAWLADERLGLARIRVRRDSTRADSAGGGPLPAAAPGAIVRATFDTLSPLLAGIRGSELAVMVDGDLVLTVPRNLRSGEAVIRYAPAARLRLAGYLWPEEPARLGESPYLWTERVGRGRVIGFAGDPNFRDLWRGLLPIFANAVFLGPSM